MNKTNDLLINQILFIMKKLFKFSLLLLLVPALLLSSCKKDPVEVERQTDPEFQTLTTYMAANNMDVSNLLDAWITTASAIKDDLGSYYIMDIRSADTYNTAHIPGAVNVAFGDVLDSAAVAAKPIIVCCYTGQGAGHAVCALRLSGYPDAKVLKWGMSGWGLTWDSWTNNTAQLDHANWTASPGGVIDNKEYDDPDLSTTATEPSDMLEERVAAMLAKGFQGIVNTDVLNDPGKYFVNNFWDATDVEHYGNITGAARVKPLTIAGEEFKYINPDPDGVVTYCWTGQTSSILTAYLTVLGFEAKSLKFGSNGMIYDDLGSHNWLTLTEDLPTESTPQ